MVEGINEIVDKLFRKGFHAHGIAFVLGLLVNENEEGTVRAVELERVRQQLLRD